MSRKATDVLLEIEENQKYIKQAINNISFLLTNLNSKISIIEQQLTVVYTKVNEDKQKVIVEAFDNTDKKLIYSAEEEVNEAPPQKELRRHSRPQVAQSYEGDDVYLKKPKNSEEEVVTFPVQVPKGNKSEIINPNQQNDIEKPENKTPVKTGKEVTIVQKVVNNVDKPLFMADVKIYNSNNEVIKSLRTSATGKWTASLPVGNYVISISKLLSLSKKGDEVKKSFIVDGSVNPLNLGTVKLKV